MYARIGDIDDIMMVTILRCWGHSHYIGDFVPMLVTFSKVSVSNISKTLYLESLPDIFGPWLK